MSTNTNVIGTSTPQNMIFVFGSNEQGKHNGGAAKAANQQQGAVYGQGFGPHGNSFALPTCSRSTSEPNYEISPDLLRFYVYCFILYAKMHPELTFQVTRVGCGLAGWADAVVAPLFAEAPANCLIDEAWSPWLPNHKTWGTYEAISPSPSVGALTDSSRQLH